MKLWPGWEEECKPANPERWGAGVYRYKRPGNKYGSTFKLEKECPGCGDPHLAQVRLVNGVELFAKYCTKSCAGLHPSEEARQHILEASQRPKSEETRKRLSEAGTGRKLSAEAIEKAVAGKRGVPRTVEVARKISDARVGKTNRTTAVVQSVRSKYASEAGTRGLVLDLTLDDVQQLILHSCFYCGVAPCLEHVTPFAGIRFLREQELVLINGIDRVDSGKGYTIDNCVTACAACNIAKSDRSISDFLSWVLRANAFSAERPAQLAYYGDVTAEQMLSAKTKFSIYRCRKPHKNDTSGGKFVLNTLDLPSFLKLIHTQCFYCGSGLSNQCCTPYYRRKKLYAAGEEVPFNSAEVLYYNGLDRVDPTTGYTLTNVVPCCVYCNRAKGDMAQSDFYAWLHRAAEYIWTTPDLLMLADQNKILPVV